MNQEPQAVLTATKTPPRVLILNAIQLLGILAAALAMPTPETAALLELFPEAFGLHVGKIALGLLAAKPAVNIVADLVDNGKLDKSVANLFPLLVFCCAAFALTSCGHLAIDPPTADGCFLVSHEHNGRTVSVGPCTGPNGKIDRYRAQWRNVAGDELRSTYTVATKARVIEYKTPEGVWVRWDSKSGISLDSAPPAAQVTPET